MLGCFFGAQGGKQEFVENLFFADSTALFKVFSGSGGSKIDEKRGRKQLGAPTLLQERLGSLLGPILEPFWEHFGLQNWFQKQPEN